MPVQGFRFQPANQGSRNADTQRLREQRVQLLSFDMLEELVHNVGFDKQTRPLRVFCTPTWALSSLPAFPLAPREEREEDRGRPDVQQQLLQITKSTFAAPQKKPHPEFIQTTNTGFTSISPGGSRGNACVAAVLLVLVLALPFPLRKRVILLFDPLFMRHVLPPGFVSLRRHRQDGPNLLQGWVPSKLRRQPARPVPVAWVASQFVSGIMTSCNLRNRSPPKDIVARSEARTFAVRMSRC